MTTEQTLISRLAEARRALRSDVDATPYAALDRETAYRVQIGVMAALDETPGMVKTLIQPDGVGVVCPIYRSGFGNSGSFRMSSANVLGLEVEVGFVLARDVAATDSEADIVGAIGHYFVGVEICGSRYANRQVAGPNGALADSGSALAYVLDPTPRAAGSKLDGFTVKLEFNGQEVYSAPPKHAFDTVERSFIAYAKAQQPHYPLRAGLVVTTGTLCGLVPTSGAGHVRATLGDHAVEFDIV